jgi:hypothetical protein
VLADATPITRDSDSSVEDFEPRRSAINVLTRAASRRCSGVTMIKTSILTGLLCVSIAGSAAATDLNLSLQSHALNSIIVGPGTPVGYTIRGELSDNASLGLAMFTFDLSWGGGALGIADTPSSDPMKRFANPEGLNNPAGFGGTQKNGRLFGVGGAQNTINNTLAPIPNGVVLTNVAQAGSPVVLATGTFTTSYRCGTYSLAATNLFANVIRQGETGSPFWHVDPCGVGTVQNLTVEVKGIRTNVSSVSVSANGAQILRLNAGPANAGRQYLVLGSLSGTSPGTVLGNGVTVPLNTDAYYNFTLNNPNSTILQNSSGVLDATGRAAALFKPDATFQNMTANHAFILLSPTNFVSEAESCTVRP